MQLLVDIPNEKAQAEKFPPSCRVLLVCRDKSATPSIVKTVQLDLASSDRRSLFVLEGKKEPVSPENLLYGPMCPVWFKDNGVKVKGTVLGTVESPNRSISEAVYKIQTEEGKTLGVAASEVSFCSETISRGTGLMRPEQVRPQKKALVSKQQSDHLPCHKLDHKKETSAPPENKPATVTKSVDNNSRSKKHEDSNTKRPLEGGSIQLSLPSWLKRDQVEDVIDDDFIKELKYSTGCSTISLEAKDGGLRICVTSSDHAKSLAAMIRLKKSMLKCVEDHEQGRLCDALDHLNSDEAPKKKPRMQVTVSHPTAVHSAETPPSSPRIGKQTGGDIEQQQNTESTDPTCRIIQVPAWVGNLDTIKEDIQRAGPWMEQNLECKIDILDSSNSKVVVRVKCAKGLDGAEEAVENLILRNVNEKIWGRILHHFAMELQSGVATVDPQNVVPSPQRNPCNIKQLIHGAVIRLPKGCTSSALNERDLIRVVSEFATCDVNIVGNEDCSDPFIFVSGAMENIRSGCTMILERMAKLGFAAPIMDGATTTENTIRRCDSSSSVASQEDIEQKAPLKNDKSRYSTEDAAMAFRRRFVPKPRQESKLSHAIQIPDWTGHLLRVLQENMRKLTLREATVEFIADKKTSVILVSSHQNLHQAVEEAEDWILSQAFACTVGGFIPAYRSRLLYHWAVQSARKGGCLNTTVVRGRRYRESALVYMFAMAFDPCDPTEVTTIFGINGAQLAKLEKSFECYISVEKHQKSKVPFVYVDGFSFEKIEGVASFITKAIEKKRKNRGSLIDLCSD